MRKSKYREKMGQAPSFAFCAMEVRQKPRHTSPAGTPSKDFAFGDDDEANYFLGSRKINMNVL